MDVKDVKVGLYNFAVVGMMALLFIVLLKMITSKYPVPGLTEVAQAA